MYRVSARVLVAAVVPVARAPLPVACEPCAESDAFVNETSDDTVDANSLEELRRWCTLGSMPWQASRRERYERMLVQLSTRHEPIAHALIDAGEPRGRLAARARRQIDPTLCKVAGELRDGARRIWLGRALAAYGACEESAQPPLRGYCRERAAEIRFILQKT